jgi:hypothetical protein
MIEGQMQGGGELMVKLRSEKSPFHGASSRFLLLYSPPWVRIYSKFDSRSPDWRMNSIIAQEVQLTVGEAAA